MASPMSMIYDFPPISLLPPAADAAGRTGLWINLRNALKIFLVCEVNQGNAATVAFNVLQATSIGGAGSKAVGTGSLEATPLHAYLNDATAAGDLFTDLGYVANYTTDATLANKIVVYEFVPEAGLDLVNGFNHITVQTGASNAANITRASAHLAQRIRGASAPTSYV